MTLKKFIDNHLFTNKKFVFDQNNLGQGSLLKVISGVINYLSPTTQRNVYEEADNFLRTLSNNASAIDDMPESSLELLPVQTQTDRAAFTFIDLFAGIGGFRIALEALNGQCLFSSEWDPKAQQTYLSNFNELPYGDITDDKVKSLINENFDVLCAGFPCQAFSIAGRRGGFSDTRGTLFFEVAKIIDKHRPKAFFLENVKGLRNHDKGKTLATILNVLRNDLGYFVASPEIINAKYFGVPQNRERIFIVGFRDEEAYKEFRYPKQNEEHSNGIESIIESEPVSAKYYLSTQYLKTLREHKARHASKGNGFGFEIIDRTSIANAIVVGGMGRERNLIIDDRLEDFTPVTRIKGEVNREGIRKMTPREWARLQGFPDTFNIPVADASAYKQFGNSVAVPAIKATAQKIIGALNHVER